MCWLGLPATGAHGNPWLLLIPEAGSADQLTSAPSLGAALDSGLQCAPWGWESWLAAALSHGGHQSPWFCCTLHAGNTDQSAYASSLWYTVESRALLCLGGWKWQLVRLPAPGVTGALGCDVPHRLGAAAYWGSQPWGHRAKGSSAPQRLGAVGGAGIGALDSSMLPRLRPGIGWLVFYLLAIPGSPCNDSMVQWGSDPQSHNLATCHSRVARAGSVIFGVMHQIPWHL